MGHRIIQILIVMQVSSLTMCNDITVFNRGEDEEDNIDKLLEREHFIKVVHRRSNKLSQTSPLQSRQEKQCEPRLNTPSQTSAHFSTLNVSTRVALTKKSHKKPQVVISEHVTSVSRININNTNNMNTPHFKDRTKREGVSSMVSWEDLAAWTMSEESEDALLQSRSKRATDPNSGDIVVKLEAVLNGSLTADQQNEGSVDNKALKSTIGIALQRYLQATFKHVTFVIEVTRLTTPLITFHADAIFEESSLTSVQLAQAMHQLDLKDNFKVGNAIYSLSRPMLSTDTSSNLLQAAICFLCRKYEACKKANQDWSCKISDSRLYPSGFEVNDNTLPANDEFVTARIEIESSLPFGETLVDAVYISINGLISFEEEFSSFSPEQLPIKNNVGEARKLLCPYWSDLDKVDADVGEVFYQRYAKSPQNTERVQQVLDRANADVALYSNSNTSFDAGTVIIATWSEMPPSPAESSDDERVTFQCIIITDEETTYVMYMYAQGAMNFDPVLEQAVVVGMGDKNLGTSRESYYRLDTVIGNTGNIGQWFFKAGYAPNNRAKCMEWYKSNVPLLKEITLWNDIIPPCPCNEISAILSFLWIKSQFQANCYDIYPKYGQFGRRCCYRDDGSNDFENRIPMAGNFQRFTPYFGDLINHETHDAAPKQLCCMKTSLCQLYYLARPVRPCKARSTEKGVLFGDPHIVTLDSKSFIFNGLGEYRLLEIDGKTRENVDINFKLQGRTCYAKGSDGKQLNATVFCAIAMQNTNGTSLNVEVSLSGVYMIIYVNNRDFTVQFNNTVTFSTNYGGIFIQKVNESLKVSTPDDIGLMITLDNSLLDFSVEINADYQGKTRGLMGNFNRDSSDDFMFPNGTVLPQNVSERMLFDYGKTWTVMDSIFVYPYGKNTSSFSSPGFVPVFLDETDPAELVTAYKFCGDKSNLPCVYDYFATQNELVAKSSKETVVTFHEDEAKAKNQPPVISSSLQLNVTVNQSTELILDASDPDYDNISYRLITSPYKGIFTYEISGTRFKAEYMPADLDSVSLEVAAVDNKGQQSEVAAVTFRICSGCSSHGSCEFENIIRAGSHYFNVVGCVCDPPWSGKNCEDDKNGCAKKPCPQGTDCMDIPAHQEAVTGKAYNCSECPKGFQLSANGTKCEDVNECNSLKPCHDHASCINKIGDYLCECNHGYRKNSKDQCVDIDECVENQHKCSQICDNTDGSYECYCQKGFTKDHFGYNCTEDISPCANMSHNCSYGCDIEAGVARCFCEKGKQIAADGYSCEDVDECREKLCSQGCTNYVGSYSCYCFAGYRLDQDGHSCESCPKNKYGTDCMNTCNCRGREVRCDSVKGCICQENWTGIYCEEDVNECLIPVSPCSSSQICENTFGSYICSCPPGYSDKNGSCVNVNECDDPSIHRCPGRCVDNPGSFTCQCTDGYSSVGNICEDINECESGISGCEHICVNMKGGFNCVCRPGFYLADDRKTCIKDLDPCQSFNISCEYACEVASGLPVCYCQLGHKLAADGMKCIDIDECTTGSHKCTDTCINSQGSYRCTCPEGKQLQNDKVTCQACDGYHWGPDCAKVCACDPIGSTYCDPNTGCQCKRGWGGMTCSEDKNECSQLATPCPSMSTCSNTAGSYLCSCNPGFQMDSSNTCSDINECEMNSPCDHNCTNTIGSYLCSCFSDGFRNEGGKCIDIDECAIPELNRCDQLCRNTQGGYACECHEGYILNTETRTSCYKKPLSQTCSGTANCSDFCRVENGQEVCFCRPGFMLASDNSSCEDINECDNSPCVNGNCSNKNGTFICVCKDGMKLAADKVSCEVCKAGFFGPNCSRPCTCNTTNTQLCMPDNGTCECYSGWNGTDCSEDVNECVGPNADDCGDNAVCVNSPGTFQCMCIVGFRTASGQCVGCDDSHFGQGCQKTCSCVTVNTLQCNDTTGECTCRSGWEGDICDTDIDECKTSVDICPGAHETCINTNGSAECKCEAGFDRDILGGNCQDINECLNSSLYTCVENSTCRNTHGGYLCDCQEGLLSASNQCIGTFVPFQVQITFMYSTDQINTAVFDNSSDAFRDLASAIEGSLLEYGRHILGAALLAVKISHFRHGSLIGSMTVYIDTQHSDNLPNDVTNLLYQLVTDQQLTINGTAVGIRNITLGSEILTPSLEKCGIYSLLVNCSFDQTCMETCQSVQPLDSNSNLIIGLAVGIPLFILLMVLTSVLACLYVRRKRKSTEQQIHLSVDTEAPFRRKFATRGFTGGSWGSRYHIYMPDTDSEIGTLGHEDRDLPKSGQKENLGYLNSVWLTQSASPDFYAHSRETTAPASDYYWENMFRLLEPHTNFEIQRPHIDIIPNPNFILRSEQPDTTA